MKSKKMNTVPNGAIILILILFEIILTLVIGIMLIPSLVSLGMFAFSIVFLLSGVYYIYKKHLNYVKVSSKGVQHKKTNYTWQEVYITITYSRPTFIRNSYDYYMFFSDHYLTKEEVESKEQIKDGFYLIVNLKRVKYLLQRYSRKVNFLGESPYDRARAVTKFVNDHNNLIT